MWAESQGAGEPPGGAEDEGQQLRPSPLGRADGHQRSVARLSSSSPPLTPPHENEDI